MPPFIGLTAHFLFAFSTNLTSPLFPSLFKLAEEFGYDREVLQEAYAWQHRGNTHSRLSAWCLSSSLIMLQHGL